MNPRRIAAVFRRIVAQFRRDPRSWPCSLWPAGDISAAGLGPEQLRASPTRVAIVNESNQPLVGAAVAQKLGAALTGQPGIIVDASVKDDAAARQALKDKALDLVVVLPPEFSATNRTIEMLTLGLNPTGESTAIPTLPEGADVGHGREPGRYVPTIERSTIYGSPDATVLDTLAPVVVGFFVYFFVFILTGISFLRERMGGTLERLLATPVSRAEIVWATASASASSPPSRSRSCWPSSSAGSTSRRWARSRPSASAWASGRSATR